MDENIKSLQEEMKKLNAEVEKLKRLQKNNKRALDTYYTLFNTLYLDFDIKPKGVLKNTQDLCQCLLDFVSYVCMKHDIQWWLDFGNLLGATRNKDFVPWDDDMDIGMTRSDCFKFLEVIDDEIKAFGLEDIVFVVKQRLSREDTVIAFTQISVKKDGGLYAGLDIFPIDFVAKPPKDVKKEFYDAKCEYHLNLIDGMDKKDVVDKFYEDYNLTYEYQDLFLPCIESFWGNSRKFQLLRSDKMFPLRKIEFKGKLYPCPNDYKYYLSSTYGKNYQNIPRTVVLHKRLIGLKRNKNADTNFKNLFKRFEDVNKKLFSEIISMKNISYYQENVERTPNINQKVSIEHTVKFTLNRFDSLDCRCYVQIGDDWDNSIFIGQTGAGNTFGIWYRKDGATDYRNFPIPSNVYVDVEYSYRDGFHTLKVNDEILDVLESNDYAYDNLLNIIVDKNANMRDLIINY